MNVTYSITEHNDVQVLSINSLLDEWQNRQILNELQPLINKGTTHFVVDLSLLKIINTTGLNFLLSLFSKSNGNLTLASASERIQHVLNITKLTTVFKLTTSVKEAINSNNLVLA